MISKEDIERINDACRIEDVVSEFVSLRKRGMNLIGLCPFHNEKTPSFTVSPSKNIYKCFGCGAAGGSVNFIMQHEQFSYPEALRYLAGKYNIEIIEKEISEEDKQLEDEKQLIYILNEMAQKFYSDYMFDSDEGKSVGLSYFLNRKFGSTTIKKFGLGYATDHYDGFVAYAISKGYKLEDLKNAGLAVESAHANDRFRGRVVFPIYSISGRVLGFGARIMKADVKTAKYLNSPETTIYHKSKVLYGLNHAKSAISKHDNCYIVEGYTDVISLFQAGIENVVASSGTSLTEDQIRLIKRYTPNVTVVFDGDSAGVKASFRGIDMLLDAGMNVKVLMLPENEDPDSFATSNRDSDVSGYFEKHAESFINYKAKFLSLEAGNDPIKKASIIKDIVQSIARIPDGITRVLFIRECSAIINISEQILTNEVSKILRQKFFGQKGTSTGDEVKITDDYLHPTQEILSVGTLDFLENRIAWLMLNYFRMHIPVIVVNEEGQKVRAEHFVSDFIIKSLMKDNFILRNAEALKVFEFFRNHFYEGTFPDTDSWITSEQDTSFRGYLVNLVTSPFELSPNWKVELNVQVQSIENAPELLTKEVKNTIAHYKLMRLQEEYALLESELEDVQDIEEQNSMIEHMKIIQSVMRDIAKVLGTTRID
jgi:DNA primase